MAQGPVFESAFQQGGAWESSLSLRATWSSKSEGSGPNAVEAEGPWDPESSEPGCAKALPGEGSLGLQTIPALWSSGPPGGRRRDCRTTGSQEAMSTPMATGRQASGQTWRLVHREASDNARLSGRLHPSSRPTLPRARGPRALPAAKPRSPARSRRDWRDGVTPEAWKSASWPSIAGAAWRPTWAM